MTYRCTIYYTFLDLTGKLLKTHQFKLFMEGHLIADDTYSFCNYSTTKMEFTQR